MQSAHSGVKPFLGEHFLLENKTAERLYHEYASRQPIIDYHNHLSPRDIAEDRKFKNLTEAWLNGDHYKWRAMRTMGISEKYITGEASDELKFRKWAATIPFTIRNPLFHWTHLELKNYFGITEILSPKTADTIYQHCNELLQKDAYSTGGLLQSRNVEVVCTTDDPTDDLCFHQQFQQQHRELKMLPAFRSDKAILIESDGFQNYIQQLGNAANISIHSFNDLLQALKNRVDFFHEKGCKLADHGLQQVYALDYTDKQVDAIFQKRMNGKNIRPKQAKKFMSAVLYQLGSMYHEKDWVQQFHLGALRNNSTRMLQQVGPDTGFDSIGDFEQAGSLAKFLNRLDTENKLCKTILYNINPKDNAVLATMIGNFNDGSVKGKMQFGSGWWFLDQKDGMEKQINALSNMGLLTCFIGMLTDSRSFLSFPRHEYFRRVLCNLIGKDVHNGELPNDIKWLGGIVEDICYKNAKAYFDF